MMIILSHTIKTCKKFYPHLKVTHRARQVEPSDFHRFHYLLCMDEQNIRDLERFRPRDGTHAIVKLLGSFDPEGETIVVDPYCCGMEQYEHNFHQIVRCCNSFLDSFAVTS